MKRRMMPISAEGMSRIQTDIYGLGGWQFRKSTTLIFGQTADFSWSTEGGIDSAEACPDGRSFVPLLNCYARTRRLRARPTHATIPEKAVRSIALDGSGTSWMPNGVELSVDPADAQVDCPSIEP